jgi:hypothetical protein
MPLSRLFQRVKFLSPAQRTPFESTSLPAKPEAMLKGLNWISAFANGVLEYKKQVKRTVRIKKQLIAGKLWPSLSLRTMRPHFKLEKTLNLTFRLTLIFF